MSAEAAQPLPSFRLVQGLTLLALAGAAWALGLLVLNLAHVWDVRSHWTTYPAVVTNRSDRDWVELEVARALLPRLGSVQPVAHAMARDADHVRIDILRQPLQRLPLFEPVELAQDPADPDRLQVMDWQGDVGPNLALTFALGLGLGGAYGLRRLRWGRDLCWSAGQWVDGAPRPTTTSSAIRLAGRMAFASHKAPLGPLCAGSAPRGGMSKVAEPHLLMSAPRPNQPAVPTQELREDNSATFWVTVWTTLFGLLAAGLLGIGLLGQGPGWLELALGLLPALGLFVLAASVLVKTRTRRVAFDDWGVVDSHFFGIRRVPWAAMSRCEVVDLNEAHRQRRLACGSAADGFGEQALPVTLVRGARGEALLDLPASMQPAPAWQALTRRIHAAIATNAAGNRVRAG